MDVNHVVAALSDTLLPDKQSESANILSEMHKIIGFVPTLLNIVLEESYDVNVRQAAAVYMKNNISEWWKNPDSDDANSFNIHEQDRQIIRASIVKAIVASPLPLQIQLKTALSKIVKCDYPSRYPDFPHQVKHFLSSSDESQYLGAFVAFYAFVKVYEFKRHNPNNNIIAVMREFTPLLYSAMTTLVGRKTEESLILQVYILKILFAFINFHFPMEVMDKEDIGRWNDVLCCVLADFSISVDDPSHPAWKTKKWSLRILSRIFTRYGCPGIVSKKHKAFAEWYLKALSTPVLNTLLLICEVYRQKAFVSKVVLAHTLEYFSAALTHSFSWKPLKTHFLLLVREVIFPLLSFSDEDAELWQDDPIEYIRYESTEFGRDVDPSAAAFSLLGEACLKRRGVLSNIMQFCMHILSSDSSPKEKDSVLHMYGAIAKLLLKKDAYKVHLEPFLLNHVLPTLHAPEGYRRARACWLIGKLSGASFNDQNVFVQVVDEIRKEMFTDPELPVRVFAAVCLSDLIRSQEKARAVVKPHLRDILLQLLKLLRETEFDDLNDVIDRLMSCFEEDIAPVAVELMQNLSLTFMQIVHSGENGTSGTTNERGDNEDTYEYRSVVATSVLDNMESLLQIAEDHDELVTELEPAVAQQIQVIFQQEMSLFYEEALSLLFSLTSSKISPGMWELFNLLPTVHENDSGDCFSEMMPCLHNYMTVDRDAFMSEPKRIETVANMCSQILQSTEMNETIQLHAAKLIEVLLLDYRGRIDLYAPKFIEISLTRLTRKVVTRTLRVMCIQIVVAGLLYSPSDVLPIMLEHHWPETSTPLLNEFLKLWLHDIDVFHGLHDRRLCVLGLCLLLSLPAAQRPPVVEALAPQYISLLLVLFSGLKRSYAAKAQNQAECDDEDEEEEDEDSADELEGKALGSDEDEIDEEGASYMEMLDSMNDESDDDDEEDEVDEQTRDMETLLEAFETELDKTECDMDEYVTFYRLMTNMEQSDPAWYEKLISPLSADEQSSLKSVVGTAMKCIQQKESKLIEQSGGYVFQSTIPSSFDFNAKQS